MITEHNFTRDEVSVLKKSFSHVTTCKSTKPSLFKSFLIQVVEYTPSFTGEIWPAHHDTATEPENEIQPIFIDFPDCVTNTVKTRINRDQFSRSYANIQVRYELDTSHIMRPIVQQELIRPTNFVGVMRYAELLGDELCGVNCIWEFHSRNRVSSAAMNQAIQVKDHSGHSFFHFLPT